MTSDAGVRSVMIEQINAAYSMGASKWQVIWHVIIPGAMPEILTSMRIAIGFGWTTLVAAEMVAATKGLGYMVLTASQFLPLAKQLGLADDFEIEADFGMRVEELFLRAGFPKGAFTTLLVSARQVEPILRDPRVRAATLTGSEPAGCVTCR